MDCERNITCNWFSMNVEPCQCSLKAMGRREKVSDVFCPYLCELSFWGSHHISPILCSCLCTNTLSSPMVRFVHHHIKPSLAASFFWSCETNLSAKSNPDTGDPKQPAFWIQISGLVRSFLMGSCQHRNESWRSWTTGKTFIGKCSPNHLKDLKVCSAQ